MKTIPIAVQAILPGRKLHMADLYTLTLRTGATLRWTGADVPVRLDGLIFKPVQIERGTVRWVMGVEVDGMKVTVFPDADLMLEGVPFAVAARAGALTDAVLMLERAYIDDFAMPAVGAVHQYEGALMVDQVTGVEVFLSVKSYLNILNREMPRRTFSPGCGNTLYDNACGVNRAARGLVGYVLEGSTRRSVQHGMSIAPGHLDYGSLEFTSGANAGVLITMTRNTAGALSLVVPLRADVAPGDSFVAFPGCDRTLITCETKFNNKPRFRGHPWIPKAETAY